MVEEHEALTGRGRRRMASPCEKKERADAICTSPLTVTRLQGATVDLMVGARRLAATSADAGLHPFKFHLEQPGGVVDKIARFPTILSQVPV